MLTTQQLILGGGLVVLAWAVIYGLMVGTQHRKRVSPKRRTKK